MADTYKVEVLKQAVFHDGKSMIVLSPATKKNPKPVNPEVEHRFIAGLVEQGSIDAPKGWKEPAKAKAEDADVIADVAPSEPAADTAP